MPSPTSSSSRSVRPKTMPKSKRSSRRRYLPALAQKAVRAEKFKFNRKAGGEGDGKHSTFQNEIGEVQQLREKLAELKVERNELRDRLHNLITEAKANVSPPSLRTKNLRSTGMPSPAAARTSPRSWTGWSTDC